MGDFGIKDALSSITSEALLEALAVIVAASLLILMVQKAVPVLAAKLSGKPRLYLLATVTLFLSTVIVLTIISQYHILCHPSFATMIA